MNFDADADFGAAPAWAVHPWTVVVPGIATQAASVTTSEVRAKSFRKRVAWAFMGG
jgi:hypothetical protein